MGSRGEDVVVVSAVAVAAFVAGVVVVVYIDSMVSIIVVSAKG